MPARIGTIAALLTACACVLVMAPAAGAATVAGGFFTASPGEANALTVTVGVDEVTFTDRGARLEAGVGCTARGEATVTCVPRVIDGVIRVEVDAGDGDDIVQADAAPLPPGRFPDNPAPFEPSPPGRAVVLTGGTGRDTLRSSAPLAATFVDGGAGEADVFQGAGRTDVVRYTGRTDPVRAVLAGAGGEDAITGVLYLVGGAGADVLTGSRTDDVLDGAGGADQVAGGAGGDVLVDAGPAERDAFDGGAGRDTVSYEGRATAVRIGFDGRAEDRLAAVEGVVGGAGADVLTGSARDERLVGGPGGDTIRGLGGDDDLVGGGGGDRLDGGTGDDTLDLGVVQGTPSVGGTIETDDPDDAEDVAIGGRGRDVVLRPAGDRVRTCETSVLQGDLTIQHRLRRRSAGSLRLRFSNPSADSRVVITPRGRSRPRLTRPVALRRGPSVVLRLTPAGRRYLRRRSAVSIHVIELFGRDVVEGAVAR